jgi:type II secretory pathway pseudopilin PulG
MKELLKLFGVPVSDNVQVSEINVAFHGISPSTALLLAAILLGATAWAYLRSSAALSQTRKIILTVLRCALLVMMLFMLMRPVLLLTVEGTIRRSLLLLIDASASMQIKDLRQDPDDLKRAAIARGMIDPKAGLAQNLPPDTTDISQLARADVVKSALTNERLQLLDTLSKTYDLVPFTFGQTLEAVANSAPPGAGTSAPPPAPNAADPNPPVKNPASFLDGITFDKPYTAIGDAVRGLLDLKRGQPLAGILLITDGGNNYGSQPLDAAALAQQDKVPLYIYGVGITSPHDIIVSQVYAPEVEFAGEDQTASITVRSQSMKGRTARLDLKLGGVVVGSQEVTFGDDGEQVIPIKFQPKQKGEYDLVASIPPLPDEAVKDNNTASQRIRVIDGKVEVLYVEEKPRWEFRYLQAMLVRDRRIDAHFYLIEGDPELSQEQGSPYLSSLPATNDDWMKYDVVILGDVDARIFNDEQMQSLTDLVSTFGGGVVFLSGKDYMPNSYRRTPLETLFPVEFEGQSLTGNGPSTRTVQLELTNAGQNSPTLRLSNDDDENSNIWQNLPGIYWDAKVTKAKPAAEVLLEDPSPEKATRSGFMPVVALQSYGAGQALFVGTDETWRWRKNVGEKYYTRFWGQMLLRLGLPRLLGASRLTQLATEKKHYVSGERVTISGRLYRSGFQPVIDPSVAGTLVIQPDDPSAPASDLKKEVTLQASPGKPGYYEGEVIVTTPGVYSFATENDPMSPIDFRVTEPKFEFGDTALNIALLKKMAQTSGGAFYREEDVYKMLEPAGAPGADETATPGQVPSGLGGATIKVPSPQEVEMAFSPFYYSLMILIASLEWFLRKRWQLK